MIYDRMERISLYGSVIPYAEDIKKRWEAGNTDGAEYEIRQKSYVTKKDSDRKFEVHYHTMDLMIGVSGSEWIHICPETELEPGDPLPNGGDGRKLIGAPRGQCVLLQPGYFVAILPEEAHMVGGIDNKPANLEKWVVKLDMR